MASEDLNLEKRRALIHRIETFPDELRSLVDEWSDEQLDTPYRAGGWTVRQLIHHLPDSHMNSYIRFKLAATEDAPTIRPYDQTRWAQLTDGRSAPADFSLSLLGALHERWSWWLRRLDTSIWRRTFKHPETGTFTLKGYLEFNAWHCDHHLAHIRRLMSREGW